MDKLALHQPTALLQLSQTHHTITGLPVLYSDSYFVCSAFEFSVIRKAVG
jgi:DNA-binding GntR family transcriptional regulator